MEFTSEPEEVFYGIDCGFRDPFGNGFRLTQIADVPVRRSVAADEHVEVGHSPTSMTLGGPAQSGATGPLGTELALDEQETRGRPVARSAAVELCHDFGTTSTAKRAMLCGSTWCES